VQLFDVSFDLRQKTAGEFREEFQADLLGGIIVLKHPGVVDEKSGDANGLYHPYSGKMGKMREIELKFIPYYAWANRSATQMQVWTPTLKA